MSPSPKTFANSSTSCALELAGAPRLALLVAATTLLLPVAVLLEARQGAIAEAAAGLLAGAVAWPAWRGLWPRRRGRAVRRLLWNPEGEFRLERTDGARSVVRLAPRSLVRGPWLVLVIEGGAGREWLVIERAAVPAAAWASLRRALARLAAGPPDSHHALRSLLQQGGPLP